MLIDRYVFREIAAPTVLGLLVWTAMLVVNHFFKLADGWVAGTLTTADVGMSLVYLLPSVLAITLPMSVLLGVLIGFARLSADSEITALRTCGVSYYRLLLPTAAVALLGWGATAVVYARLVPWANTAYVDLQQRALRKIDINREIRPREWVSMGAAGGGSGQESAIYARGVDESTPGEPWLKDVDILKVDRAAGVAEHHRADRVRITRLVVSEEASRLRYEMEGVKSLRWSPDDPAQVPQVSEASVGERLGPEMRSGPRSFSSRRSIEKGTRMQTIAELRETLRQIARMEDADALAVTDPAGAARMRAGSTVPPTPPLRERLRRVVKFEIQKKLAIPVACIVFAAAAVPLGIVTRRGGRPASFIISIGIVAIWYVIYSAAEAWVFAGKMSAVAGAWLPNIVLGIVALNLLVGQRRQQAVGLYRGLRDAFLLGAMVFLVLAGLLVYERLAIPPTPGEAADFPAWVPIVGLVLLAAHVAFVLGRDRISRRLALLAEAFRRPRRETPAEAFTDHAPTGAPAGTEPGLAPGGEASPALRRRRVLERLRNATVFALLALVTLSVLDVMQSDEGVAGGLAEVLASWRGAALLLLIVACGFFQHAGARIVTILDAWVLGTFARMLVLIVGSVYVLVAVSQYIALADDILQNRVPASQVLTYFAYMTPGALLEVLPIEAMMAVLVTFGVMTKFNETTALRCGGVSVYRMVAPVVLVALLFSGVAFVLHDHVLPGTNEKADTLRRTIQGSSPNKSRAGVRGFMVGEDGAALYQFRSVVMPDARRPQIQPQLLALTVIRQDEEGRVRELYSAADAEWSGSEWTLRAGWRAVIDDERRVAVTTFTTHPMQDMEPPGSFSTTKREPQQMAFGEYRRYVQEQEEAGYPTAALRVVLQRKLAGPAQTLVLVLVGIPFAFTTGRRGALYGLGVAVILAIVFHAGLALFTALGTAELLPPAAAAWAMNAIFAIGAVYLMLHVRT